MVWIYIMIWMKTDFSSETMETRKQWNNIFKSSQSRLGQPTISNWKKKKTKKPYPSKGKVNKNSSQEKENRRVVTRITDQEML